MRSITSDATYTCDFAYNNVGQLYTLTHPVSTAGVWVTLKYLHSNEYVTGIRYYTSDMDGTTHWALNQMNARGQATDEAVASRVRRTCVATSLDRRFDNRFAGRAAGERGRWKHD